MNRVFRTSAIPASAIPRPLGFLATCLMTWGGVFAFLISPALAQVNGLGPSPASDFDTVLNLPGDEPVITGGFGESVGGMSGQTVQLNISNGGTLGNNFVASFGSEVNISGGTVGRTFLASGSFGSNPASEVNISGGTIGDSFLTSGDSVVNISGGTFDFGFTAMGGEINISGGTIGNGLQASIGSELNISGGTFGDNINIDSSNLNISGGVVVGNLRISSGSDANISGGTVGSLEVADSEVNISGGTVESFDVVGAQAQVNFIGSGFQFNGVELDTLLIADQIDPLQPDQPFTIVARNITLSGFLADGEEFSVELNTGQSSSSNFFGGTSTVTVTLASVPEPSSSAFITLVVALGLARRRRVS